jgi:hypothetical protein
MTERLRKAVVSAFVLLWLGSLFLPTLRTNGADWDPGWWLLASGWLGLLIGQLAWLANPLLILAALLLLRGRGRTALGIVGGALLLLWLQMALTGALVDNEGGIAHPIERRYAGFWLWMAAIGLAGLTSVAAAMAWRTPAAGGDAA